MKTTKEVHQVKTTYVNRSDNHINGEDVINIGDSIIDDVKSLYKYGLSDFGRCIGKIYIDDDDNSAKHVGYIFVKRVKYTDCDETFLQEVWFSIDHYIETITRKII